MKPIHFTDVNRQRELLHHELQKSIDAVFSHGKYINGPEVALLEEKLAEKIGVTHAIAVSSGTSALFVALHALGVRKGDYVITTPFTFAATAEAICMLDANILFVDIESETYNIDSEKVKALLDNPLDPATGETIPFEKIKGIIPVDLYGHPADYDTLREIIGEREIFILEDAAQSLGAKYKGKMAGSLGDVSITSFYPSKPLGGYGDGGMIFTNDEAIAFACRRMRNHGQDKKYNHESVGLNFRLDSLNAAMILPKIELFFNTEVGQRQEVARQYTEKLQSVKERIQLPVVDDEVEHIYAQYSIRTPVREKIQEELRKKNIPTAIHYPKPLHLQKAFAHAGYKEGSFPVAEKIATEILSLPMDAYKTEEEITHITQAIKDITLL